MLITDDVHEGHFFVDFVDVSAENAWFIRNHAHEAFLNSLGAHFVVSGRVTV